MVSVSPLRSFYISINKQKNRIVHEVFPDFAQIVGMREGLPCLPWISYKVLIAIFIHIPFALGQVICCIFPCYLSLSIAKVVQSFDSLSTSPCHLSCWIVQSPQCNLHPHSFCPQPGKIHIADLKLSNVISGFLDPACLGSSSMAPASTADGCHVSLAGDTSFKLSSFCMFQIFHDLHL